MHTVCKILTIFPVLKNLICYAKKAFISWSIIMSESCLPNNWHFILKYKREGFLYTFEAHSSSSWTWSNDREIFECSSSQTVTFQKAHQWRSCFTVTALFNIQPSIHLSPLNKLIVLMCQNWFLGAFSLLLPQRFLIPSLHSLSHTTDLWPLLVQEKTHWFLFPLHKPFLIQEVCNVLSKQNSNKHF